MNPIKVYDPSKQKGFTKTFHFHSKIRNKTIREIFFYDVFL